MLDHHTVGAFTKDCWRCIGFGEVTKLREVERAERRVERRAERNVDKIVERNVDSSMDSSVHRSAVGSKILVLSVRPSKSSRSNDLSSIQARTPLPLVPCHCFS